MNLLLATLGGSWQVIPEVYGFTNPGDLPLYRDSGLADEFERIRIEYRIDPVDEIWVVTTAGVREQREKLREWRDAMGAAGPVLRAWWPDGMEDIGTGGDARRMAELLNRLAWHAHRRAGESGKVLLSLAGGRKTMSADLQRAGGFFGRHALLHVIDRVKNWAGFDELPLTDPLGERWRELLQPLVVAGARPPSKILALPEESEKIEAAAGLLPDEGAVPVGDTPLLDELARLQRSADALLANYGVHLSSEERAGAFRAFYTLPVRTLERLRSEERIGVAGEARESDLEWLRSLPKAELHCHLGGILSPAEMIEVANSEAERVAGARKTSPAFGSDLDLLERAVAAADLHAVRRFVGEGGVKCLRERWQGVPEPLGVCGFLLAFRERKELLEEFIYGDLLDPAHFRAVGIDRYEKLGDLQGSGLLQLEATLRVAMSVLERHCREDNVRYLELRCTPGNCTRGGLDEKEVVRILAEEAARIDRKGVCDVRLLFIASRHREPAEAKRNAALALGMMKESETFRERFAGFDLAGAEGAAGAGAFRKIFRPLHEKVLRITIHAGEDQPVQSVWEAVYELSADRVGHGLTLGDDPELLNRFRDRAIAVEMCPSSNYQVRGFRDFLQGETEGGVYPLAAYLGEGLRITVNTDDPGISRTSLSEEYLKAATMTEGGLTRWQVLQLVRNGFQAAFCDYEKRREHLLDAEKQIIESLVESVP